MKLIISFPQTVEYKSCTATIYLQKHASKERFEVRYYDLDGSMQRLSFATHEMASKFADTTVRALSANRENFVTLRGADAYNYRSALELLTPTGLTLLQAATLVTDGLRLLDGSTTIPQAIKYYLENRPQKSPSISVREVVNQLLALKEKEGDVGQLYLRDLRLRLEKFARAFQCPISKVSPQHIRDYLLNMDVSNRTRHNQRTTLTTLFNFAKGEGYLPADHKGVPRPTKRSRLKLAIKIFTPEEMAKLLDGATPNQIVALSLMGFAGVRAEELKRLEWQHIDFDEKHIVVPDNSDNKNGTPALIAGSNLLNRFGRSASLLKQMQQRLRGAKVGDSFQKRIETESRELAQQA
jgi:site-specific recombinase XerC